MKTKVKRKQAVVYKRRIRNSTIITAASNRNWTGTFYKRGIYITSGRNSGWSTFVCQWQSGIDVKYDAI